MTDDHGAVDDLRVPPPPVRKLLAGDEPTIILPPRQGALAHAGGNGSGVAPAAATRTLHRPATNVVERMRAEHLMIAYGGKPAVNGVTLPVRQGEVLALIGPSGCGKTTLLRSLNRLTELTPGATRTGRITLDGEDVDGLEVNALRRRVSMVFQQPNPFPMSVFDNVAYALREQGAKRPKRGALMEPVTDALRRAGLLDEMADDLSHPALRLSGGQQQRLCIARALAARPEVLLLDEPCSALDPLSTATIEELIVRLRDEVAVVIVTHNLQQAHRIADKVGFMYLGDLVEYGDGDQMFSNPSEARTREYVAGGFG